MIPGVPGFLRLSGALARADFLERTRRFSSLVTLFGMIFMAWQAMPADPRQFSMSLQLGDYRGVYNSAWVGGLLAMLVTTLLTLVGFYLVKNAVERDRLTGVGEILATTPISRPAYTVGKTISNFVFLAALPATLLVAGLGMQYLRGEDRHLDPWLMAQPLILVCLPPLALVAALAVLFECVRWLRGTLGNVIYFFLWVFGLTAGFLNRIDLLGVNALHASMGAACRARYPDYNLSDLVIGGGIEPIKGTFVWNGVDWTTPLLLERLAGFGGALIVALAAAAVFDRFDPTRGAVRVAAARGSGGKRRAGAALGAVGAAAPHDAERDGDARDFAHAADRHRAAGADTAPITLTPLAQGARHVRLVPLVRAELRLMFQGLSRWWLLALLGLAVAGVVAPAPAGQFVRGIAWIWPIALWSGMGVRASRHGTEELLLSSPGPRRVQWPATLMAGILVALLPGVGCVIQAAAAHGEAGAATAAAGIVFVPTLAFALGRLSGSSRLFEVVYLLIWYLGPMNALPMLDYTGGAPGLSGPGTAVGLVLAAAALLAVAAFVPDRRR